MTATRSILALLFAILVVVTAEVVDLTPTNFDSIISGDKHALVEFYAPWCGHCKSLAPTYEELSTVFKHATKDLVIAKVDADAHRELGTRFGVQGFPTLKWFPKGSTTPEDYQGGRSLEDLASYIKDKTSINARIKKVPTDVATLTSSTFDEIVMDPAKHVLVTFTAPWCGHCKNLKPTYEKLAKTFATEPNVVIANVDATAHPDLGERFGVQGYPTIKYFPAGKDKAPVAYEGGRDEADFVEFLNANAGTHRSAGGALNAAAGVLDSMAGHVRAFMNAEDRAAALKEIKTKVTDAKDKTAALYVKAMEKVVAKGDEYLAKESARLQKLLKDETVVQAKKDLFATRANILRTFQEAFGVAETDDAEVAEEKPKEEL
ncbi:protein disulfide-isomerase domain [Allomyces macrogynus ATCC 38327]|uniref:protein disulfide-isomerase n=1 Tax=Allomyces macrogynus (strain ATCC 38327) TaxID=578462 RepID=A0A0L0RWP5_ALLM3|nr:protein disulfide-isomerase domain [Allomyces macrogynus ATCC 38327]|eukprot:KNE54550.1 protein disulfide-isomerase domain [Allomyces macrogynus ATCC 38327]